MFYFLSDSKYLYQIIVYLKFCNAVNFATPFSYVYQKTGNPQKSDQNSHHWTIQ